MLKSIGNFILKRGFYSRQILKIKGVIIINNNNLFKTLFIFIFITCVALLKTIFETDN